MRPFRIPPSVDFLLYVEYKRPQLHNYVPFFG